MSGLEAQIERDLIAKLQDLKYDYRPDIQDRFALERNFRTKFEELNRVSLSETEFQRLLEKIVTPDVFAAAKSLRHREMIERDDGTPLNYTLVNIRDWCKNSFEVINQLRINTDNSHHRYDVILLINGVPVVQIELKAYTISPRRAMQQIVEYKNEPGNGYRRTLLCFIQLFVVSNRNDTWYFANNNATHFRFNADEQAMLAGMLAPLPRTRARHLLDQGLWLTGRAGDVLTRENEPVSHLYYLAAGEARVVSHGREVGICRAGDLIGEVTVLSGEAASATVVLSGPARLWCAPANVLRPYLKAHPDVRQTLEQGFATSLKTKLRSSNERLVEMSEAAA